jgi:hypothetical protein
MFESLKRFKSIGWDFDGTLIDHPKSPLMHDYILEHPEQEHIIITFRTHGWQNAVFREMAQKYRRPPTSDHFSGVYNISDRAWERWTETQNERRAGQREGPATPWELYYVNWKGLVCKLKSIPVLIDDKPSDTVPGCEKYGIAFVHPDTL